MKMVQIFARINLVIKNVSVPKDKLQRKRRDS